MSAMNLLGSIAALLALDPDNVEGACTFIEDDRKAEREAARAEPRSGTVIEAFRQWLHCQDDLDAMPQATWNRLREAQVKQFSGNQHRRSL